MNVHDSEKILGVLEQHNYLQTDKVEEADLIIFNTCSIREKAAQKFYSELGRLRSLKKNRPGLRIAAAGCIAQQDGDNVLKRAPHVDFIFGPQNIHILEDIDNLGPAYISLEDNPDIANRDLPVRRGDALRAWVTIMYGCDNFCSYCVVPYTRGRERSRPSKHICQEITELAASGCKEVTLLGQNVNSYRSDTTFPGLLKRLNDIDGIERIRFVTSHPKDLSRELIDAIGDLNKVCEHIHLPLQSGSNRVLKCMNRVYTYDDYRAKVHQLRDKVPGISITSDIIAGFPGECEDDHRDTLRALEETEFDGIFAFKYSSRPFTKAADMTHHLDEDLKSSRLNEILAVQDSITARRNRALEGTIQEILLEGPSETDKDKMSGRTRTNKIVTIRSSEITRGTILRVEIAKARRHSLEGRLLRT